MVSQEFTILKKIYDSGEQGNDKEEKRNWKGMEKVDF